VFIILIINILILTMNYMILKPEWEVVLYLEDNILLPVLLSMMMHYRAEQMKINVEEMVHFLLNKSNQ
jgi:hypothetical protein